MGVIGVGERFSTMLQLLHCMGCVGLLYSYWVLSFVYGLNQYEFVCLDHIIDDCDTPLSFSLYLRINLVYLQGNISILIEID